MRWVILLGAMCAGCGAAVDEPAATSKEPMLGCSTVAVGTAKAECSFAAEAGRPYWAEATGDVVPAMAAEVCDAAGCQAVERTFAPGKATVQVAPRAVAGTVTVRWSAPR